MTSANMSLFLAHPVLLTQATNAWKSLTTNRRRTLDGYTFVSRIVTFPDGHYPGKTITVSGRCRANCASRSDFTTRIAVIYRVSSSKLTLEYWKRQNYDSIQGQIQESAKGEGSLRFLPLPFFSPFLSPSSPFPLEVGPLKPSRGSGERCKLAQWGSGQSPCRKRIYCTLMLPESHWGQSFWIFWVPCFTVERSTFSISNHYRKWVRQSVAQGGGAARPSLNPPLQSATKYRPHYCYNL